LCILIVCKPGATLPREHLLGSIENNPNGAGYAIHKGDSLFVERGLNDLELVDSFLANRTQWPEGPAMFHARIASAGDVTDANCHPFQVGEHNDIVLAHNGAMLPLKGYGPFMADNSKSDTRVFAESYLPEIGIESLDILAVEWLAWLGYNKVAVLSASPLLTLPVYIFGQDRGFWRADTDCWYSNGSYYQHKKLIKWPADTYDWEDWPRHGTYWWNKDTKTIKVKDPSTSLIPALPAGEPDNLDDLMYPVTCGLCSVELGESDYKLGECVLCGYCLECETSPCVCFYGHHIPENSKSVDPIADDRWSAAVQRVLDGI
jgi:hypothetical protein